MFLFSITLVVFSLGVFMMTVAEFVLVGQISEEKKALQNLGIGLVQRVLPAVHLCRSRFESQLRPGAFRVNLVHCIACVSSNIYKTDKIKLLMFTILCCAKERVASLLLIEPSRYMDPNS